MVVWDGTRPLGIPTIADCMARTVAKMGAGNAQRVVLYEEDPHDPAVRRFMGSVVWGTLLPPGAQPRDAELRGEITIPERKLASSLR